MTSTVYMSKAKGSIELFEWDLTESSTKSAKSASSGRKGKFHVEETEVGFEASEGSANNDSDDLYPKSFKLYSILLALVLSVFLVALDMTIVATAIPRITQDFNSLADIGWYGSAFFLTLASFQSTWGKAYKFFPLKMGFLFAIGIFEGGSLLCAVAGSSSVLIIGRAVAGVGGAGIASGAYTIIALSAPPNRRAAFTGILGAVYAVASVIGPPLGGIFTDGMTWRWCFWINLPIGGVAAIIILLFFTPPKAGMPKKATPAEKFLQMDFLGTAILMGAILCLLRVLEWGGVTKKWVSGEVMGTLGGAGGLIVVFIIVEIWQGERASIEPRLMKMKTVALMSAFQVFNSGLFLVLLYYLPLYFQVVKGASASASGIHNLPFVLGVALFTIMSGVGVTLTLHYIPFMLIGVALASVGAAMVYTLGLNSPSGQWIGYQILAGAVGLTVQLPVIVGQAIVEPTDVSSITAIMVFFQTMAGAVFVSVGQSLFANKLLQTTARLAPMIPPQLVLGTGATSLRKVFQEPILSRIVYSYLAGLQQAYILGIVLAGLSAGMVFVIALIDWKKLEHVRLGGG